MKDVGGRVRHGIFNEAFLETTLHFSFPLQVWSEPLNHFCLQRQGNKISLL
jgi:hypothetical protein